ncbi:MAG TPA: hypothetical protein VHD33_07010, partial [Legionellaceae bacterium]|nr:hypothetical protein [Legionellaceae bacterium]
WIKRHQLRLGYSTQNKDGYTIINVLPRNTDVDFIRSTITKHHKALLVCGSPISIHAPNLPSLRRCKHCSELGHSPDRCPLIQGVALRLLCNQTIPYSQMIHLKQLTKARRAYLASGPEIKYPHRKLTLIFDADINDVNSMNELEEQLAALVSSKEVTNLISVNIFSMKEYHRIKECKDCNHIFTKADMNDVHICTWNKVNRNTMQQQSGNAVPQQPVTATAAHPSAASQTNSTLGAGRVASTATTTAAAGPISSNDDRICYNWRRVKTCPRRDKNQPCKFLHPMDQVPEQPNSTNHTRFRHTSTNAAAAKGNVNANAKANTIAPTMTTEVAAQESKSVDEEEQKSVPPPPPIVSTATHLADGTPSAPTPAFSASITTTATRNASPAGRSRTNKTTVASAAPPARTTSATNATTASSTTTSAVPTASPNRKRGRPSQNANRFAGLETDDNEEDEKEEQEQANIASVPTIQISSLSSLPSPNKNPSSMTPSLSITTITTNTTPASSTPPTSNALTSSQKRSRVSNQTKEAQAA